MPNSGTVSAGSVALASQYNNLRADVLSNTTGHVHDGTTDGGKQIEGTALKSTGATTGQYLTATAGTGATWATPSVGALASVTGTATWAAYSTAQQAIYNAAAVSAYAVTGNGTVITSVTTTANTSARTLYYWNLTSTNGTATRAGTATPALITAGTVSQISIGGKGYSGDGVVFFEGISATTSGTVSGSLRRYTSNLATNSWNTTIYSAAAYASVNWNQWTQIAYVSVRPIWISQANMWLGFDTRTTTGGTSFVHAVNDTTGTLYSAAWGTTVSGSDGPSTVDWAAYVPGVSGADGTVHLFAQRQTSNNPTTYNFLRIAYTLGTAAITAASTASSTSGYPSLSSVDEGSNNGAEYPVSGYWDDALSNYVLITTTRDSYFAVGFERTMGTVVWRSRIQNTTAWNNPKTGSNTQWDSVTRLLGVPGNTGRVWQAGSAGDFYYGMRPTLSVTHNQGNNTDDQMAGAGSATHVLFRNTGGSQTWSMPMANLYTSYTIAASTSARMVSFDSSPTGDARPIAAIAAASAYPLNWNLGEITNPTTLTQAQISSKSFPIILPANTTMTVFASNYADQRGGAVLNPFSLNQNLAAATAVYTFRTISLG